MFWSFYIIVWSRPFLKWLNWKLKTPSGTYDPIWLISRFLNTAYEYKAVYIASGSLRVFLLLPEFLMSMQSFFKSYESAIVEYRAGDGTSGQLSPHCCLPTPQPQLGGGGGGGISLTKGVLPIGYMDYGIQDWLINYMN